MGKALHVFSNSLTGVPTTNKSSPFGFSLATTDAASQASWLAGAFTRLGRNNRGGSGTNVVQLRVGGSDVNNVTSASGTGWLEDTTHTDNVSTGDLVNINYTDDGTNPTYSVIKILFEATGDHCWIAGQGNGTRNYDVASSTRYVAFFGPGLNDGYATETDTQLKNRGGETLRRFQVGVTSNARTNQSDFRIRINAANGNGIVSFAAGATGLVVDTSNTDTLADGDLYNASVTLGTGVEDLFVTVAAVAVTNASASKNDIVIFASARAASATPEYFPLGGTSSAYDATEANVTLQPGYAATASKLRAYVTANTYTGDATLTLRSSGSDLISLVISAGATGWIENESDTGAFVADDDLCYEIVDGTANSITLARVMLTITASAAAVISPGLHGIGFQYVASHDGTIDPTMHKIESGIAA